MGPFQMQGGRGVGEDEMELPGGSWTGRQAMGWALGI